MRMLCRRQPETCLYGSSPFGMRSLTRAAPKLIGKRSRLIVTDANGQKAMLGDTSPDEAEIVARAIEAEADRLEAQSKGSQDVSNAWQLCPMSSRRKTTPGPSDLTAASYSQASRTQRHDAISNIASTPG